MVLLKNLFTFSLGVLFALQRRLSTVYNGLLCSCEYFEKISRSSQFMGANC